MFFNCKKNNEEFKLIEKKMTTYIVNNEWESLFELIKNENIPEGFTIQQEKRLEELSTEIVIKYKDYKLEMLKEKKDTIIYGFVLNSSMKSFKSRIKELRKANGGGFKWGKWSFQNYFPKFKYELEGYKQHFVSDGVDCDLVISPAKTKIIKAIRLKSFNDKNDKNFRSLLSLKYGKWVDIPSKYKYGNNKYYGWEYIYSLIKRNYFNVFQIYFLNKKEVIELSESNYNSVIFNSNFAIIDDALCPRILSYDLFFEEYEKSILDIKDKNNLKVKF